MTPQRMPGSSPPGSTSPPPFRWYVHPSALPDAIPTSSPPGRSSPRTVGSSALSSTANEGAAPCCWNTPLRAIHFSESALSSNRVWSRSSPRDRSFTSLNSATASRPQPRPMFAMTVGATMAVRRSLLLRVEGGFDTPRELLGRALRPEVQKHDARLLVRHVVVDRDDVDVRVTQRLEDILQLVFEHREVAIDHRGSLAPRERRPGVHAHRLPHLGAVHGRLAAEGELRDPVLRLRRRTEDRLERLPVDRALRREALERLHLRPVDDRFEVPAWHADLRDAVLHIRLEARDLRDQLRVGLLGRSTPRYGHSEDQQQQHARRLHDVSPFLIVRVIG